ncbi:hypothetical protein, partial [Yersinia massiliensis]|uniref:hypothetical protein n=1 Tax=Yersinia massiliensis TaxID=419257 RepID=UPI001C93901D
IKIKLLSLFYGCCLRIVLYGHYTSYLNFMIIVRKIDTFLRGIAGIFNYKYRFSSHKTEICEVWLTDE